MQEVAITRVIIAKVVYARKYFILDKMLGTINLSMMPKLHEAIEILVAKGAPTQYIPYILIKAGWPEALVNQAVESWMISNGRALHKTGFKDWLKKYYRLALPAVIVVVIINLIADGITLLKPWPLKLLADSAFGTTPAPGPLEPYTHTPTLILIVSLASIALFVLGALFGFIQDFLLLRIGFWLNRKIKAESLNHILHLPLFHQERLAKGDYVYRQNIVTNSLSDLVLASTSSIIGSAIMIVAIIAIMLSFNVALTFFTIVLIPLLFLTMKIVGPKMGKYNQALTELASDTAAKVNEAVDNAETVQAFTLESKQLNHINELWNIGYLFTKKAMFWGKLLENGNGLLVILATSGVMYFGGTAALNGKMTFGDLLVFMTYMGYLLSPVQNMVQQITSRNKKLIDVHRVYEVLSDHEGIEDLRNDRHLPPHINGNIVFQNVSYSYKDNLALKEINLTIKAGEKVAIIGPSGSGKSTLLKLIPLFVEPDGGRITIDGFDIQTVSLHDLRKKISWVSQTPQLFDGTILDNLYDADIEREFTSEEILKAIRTANVTEFAKKLPMGLETPTGENGGSLSGGQRQRVAIARTLLRDAPIICLDEPTAALDAKSENYIKDSLGQMIQNHTVVMVTHRRALLALMDTVYVLEDNVITNVNELGGVDKYLARLEGLQLLETQEELPEEIRDVDMSDYYDEKSHPINNKIPPEATFQSSQNANPMASAGVVANDATNNAETIARPQTELEMLHLPINQVSESSDRESSLASGALQDEEGILKIDHKK